MLVMGGVLPADFGLIQVPALGAFPTSAACMLCWGVNRGFRNHG